MGKRRIDAVAAPETMVIEGTVYDHYAGDDEEFGAWCGVQTDRRGADELYYALAPLIGRRVRIAIHVSPPLSTGTAGERPD